MTPNCPTCSKYRGLRLIAMTVLVLGIPVFAWWIGGVDMRVDRDKWKHEATTYKSIVDSKASIEKSKAAIEESRRILRQIERGNAMIDAVLSAVKPTNYVEEIR